MVYEIEHPVVRVLDTGALRLGSKKRSTALTDWMRKDCPNPMQRILFPDLCICAGMVT
jgi:hypothetical protein